MFTAVAEPHALLGDCRLGNDPEGSIVRHIRYPYKRYLRANITGKFKK